MAVEILLKIRRNFSVVAERPTEVPAMTMEKKLLLKKIRTNSWKELLKNFVALQTRNCRMLTTGLRSNINNFKGFRREVWILAHITFINRAGTMVLPFLSKYLKENLHFTYGEVGWIMVAFGFGSMLGSWLGGKPENRVRAMSLLRLGVNLGFAAGPTLGGLIILGMGYPGLFWIDGSSCIISILIFVLMVKEKKRIPLAVGENPATIIRKSIYKDKPFWLPYSPFLSL